MSDLPYALTQLTRIQLDLILFLVRTHRNKLLSLVFNSDVPQPEYIVSRLYELNKIESEIERTISISEHLKGEK
jgi:hypothetical protein